MIKTDNKTVNSFSTENEMDKMDKKKEYPTPTDLIISTCTVVSNINDDFNLDLFSRIVPVYNTNDPILETKDGGIHNITLYTDYSRGTFSEEKKKKIKEFNNQVTIEFKYWGFRTINIKIFTNGKLQMTGIKNNSEAEMITNKIINYIKTLPIKIYTNENNVDKSYGINWIYNYQKKKIEYLRKYNNTIKKLIDISTYKYSEDHLFTHTEIRNILNCANKHLTIIQNISKLITSILKNINVIIFEDNKNHNQGKQKYKSFNYSHNNNDNTSEIIKHNIIESNILENIISNIVSISSGSVTDDNVTNDIEINNKNNYIISNINETDALNKLNILFDNIKKNDDCNDKNSNVYLNNQIIIKNNISNILSFIIKYIKYHLKTIDLEFNNNIDYTNPDNFNNVFEYITDQIENYHTFIYKTGTKISKVRLKDEDTCNILNTFILKDINKEVENMFLQDNFDKEIRNKVWSYKIQDTYNVKKDFKICEVKTELINSDYNVRFYIDLKKLTTILKSKYNIFNSYEPDGYPGVLAKYYYNPNNKIQGICNCPVHCSTKEKKTSCCKITISIFRPGSVIITGAKSIEQLTSTYKFINKILYENYETILGKCDEEEQKNGFIINDIRKISRKPRLFYVKKNNIIY
jgi:TATA-box binding protein (TBP) (component of TFIID and TFIIIB)